MGFLLILKQGNAYQFDKKRFGSGFSTDKRGLERFTGYTIAAD